MNYLTQLICFGEKGERRNRRLTPLKGQSSFSFDLCYVWSDFNLITTNNHICMYITCIRKGMQDRNNIVETWRLNINCSKKIYYQKHFSLLIINMYWLQIKLLAVLHKSCVRNCFTWSRAGAGRGKAEEDVRTQDA